MVDLFGRLPHTGAYVSIRVHCCLALMIAGAGCSQWFSDFLPDQDVPVQGDILWDGWTDPHDGTVHGDPGAWEPGADPGGDPEKTDTGCFRDCYYKICGSDGCGGTCGSCPDGTACSADRGRCILQATQQPLGGACGPNAYCQPFVPDPFTVDGYYRNGNWPACLADQCREGDCSHGVCSRPCKVATDVVQNGTGAPFPDGIEDSGGVGDCGDVVDGPYGTVFTCVEVEATADGGWRGMCLPSASFAPCTASSQCVDGEACGFVQIRDNVESRCVHSPRDSVSLAGECGDDIRAIGSRNCAAWNCSEAGCSQACDGDDACITVGAACEVDGRCRGTGRACSNDADCSAWACSSEIRLAEPFANVIACAPRDCAADADCRDPGFYCLHRAMGLTPTSMQTVGRCAPRVAGGATAGEDCDVSPGDGVPDRPCANEAYCLDGRCGSMCAEDADCPLVPLQRCGRVDVPSDLNGDGVSDIVLSVPNCVWVGTPGTPCAVQADCESGVCTPWALTDGDAVRIELSCMTPPAGAHATGSLCGAGASGATCDSRTCLDERPQVAAPGVCSSPCRTRADCPGLSAVGSRTVRWVCEARPFSQSGTLSLGDDRYVSWCVPVPSASSLASCAGDAWCANPSETCRAVVRAGAPGGLDAVDYVCVRPEGGRPVGATCDATGDGAECATGLCVPTGLPGVGYCSRVCASEMDCVGIAGGAATCSPRVVIAREDPAKSVVVPICRPLGTCIVCRDDRDCDADQRCANLSTSSWSKDLRCVPACETDLDCPVESPTCTEIRGTTASSVTGLVNVCLPVTCAG